MNENETIEKKDKKKKKNKEINKDLDTQIIVPKKISVLAQMRKDIKSLESLDKDITSAKRNAISANNKLQGLLDKKKELEERYNS